MNDQTIFVFSFYLVGVINLLLGMFIGGLLKDRQYKKYEEKVQKEMKNKIPLPKVTILKNLEVQDV